MSCGLWCREILDLRGRNVHTASRENNFDLIRLFAAAQVVWIHSVAHLGFPIGPTWLYALLNLFPGVAVFFVVSGFLITGSVQRQDFSIRAYFASRALRIYPALWVNILGLIALVYWVGQFNGDMRSFWLWAATFFATGNDYLANFWPQVDPFIHQGFYTNLPPSGVLWTIPIEISFYFLAPLIVGLWVHRRFIGVSLFAWGMVSMYVFMTTELYGYPDQIMKYLWIFLLGAAMRIYWAKIRPLLEGRAAYWTLAYLTVGMAAFSFHGTEYLYWNRTALSVFQTILLACAVISIAHTAPIARKLLQGNDLSYGLYLWHMPVIWTFVGFGLRGVGASACAWLIAGILAVLSWLLVEKPAMTLKGRKRAGTRPSHAT